MLSSIGAVIGVTGTLSVVLFRKSVPTCVVTTPGFAALIEMLTFAVIACELGFR
jgi:hypothetical protein